MKTFVVMIAFLDKIEAKAVQAFAIEDIYSALGDVNAMVVPVEIMSIEDFEQWAAVQ